MALRPRWCNLVAWLAAALGAVLTVAGCVLLWLRMLPLGLPGQWYWPLRQMLPHFWPTQFGIIIVAGAAVYVTYLVRPKTAPRVAPYLFGVLTCCCAAFGMMRGLYLAEGYAHLRTAQVTSSVAALPYYGEAVMTDDVGELLRHYGDCEGRKRLPDRLRTHPPGPVLYFVCARRAILASPGLIELGRRQLALEGIAAADAPALVQGYTAVPMTAEDVIAGMVASLLLSFLGVLTPAALFLVAWAITEPKTALVSALLAAVIPSLLLFVPSIDGLGTVVVLGALGTFLWSLRRGSHALAVLSALLWAAAFFWSVGLLVLALPAAAVLVYHLRQARQRRAALAVAGVTAGVFVLTFALLYVAVGYNPVANTAEILVSQGQIMAAAGRDRLAWTLMNMYEFGLFLGPMLAVTSLAGLACALYGPDPRGSQAQGGARGAIAYLGLGLLAAFVLLDASGSTRGEVGRIWLFLMPLFAIYAAHLRHYVSERAWLWHFPPLLGAQLAIALYLFAYTIPVQP